MKEFEHIYQMMRAIRAQKQSLVNSMLIDSSSQLNLINLKLQKMLRCCEYCLECGQMFDPILEYETNLKEIQEKIFKIYH